MELKTVEEYSKEMTRDEFDTFVSSNNLWPVDFNLPDDETENAWNKALTGITFKAAVPELPKEALPVIKQLQVLELEAKKITEKEKSLKEELLNAMETHGIKKWENDLISVTYTAPTTRTSIDSAKLKKDLPEVAAKYSKTSNVKSSIRIKVK